MSRERIVSYYRELATFVKQANELKGGIDQITAQIEIAKAAENADQVAKGMEQRDRMRALFDKTVALAVNKANKADLPGCEKLLRDLEARLKELDELDQVMAQVEAAFEMTVAMEEFTSLEERAEAEAKISKLRSRATKQLELTDALVPNKAVILGL